MNSENIHGYIVTNYKTGQAFGPLTAKQLDDYYTGELTLEELEKLAYISTIEQQNRDLLDALTELMKDLENHRDYQVVDEIVRRHHRGAWVQLVAEQTIAKTTGGAA